MAYFRNAASNGPPPSLTDTNYAFWAHVIAAIASLCSAGLIVPLIAPFIVLLFTPSRHPFLMFHLNQAVFFQLLIHIVQIVLATVLWFVAFVTCGLGLPLLAFLVFPWLLPRLGFWLTLLASAVLTVVCFLGLALALRRFAILLLP